jgi:hypothetical protein
MSDPFRCEEIGKKSGTYHGLLSTDNLARLAHGQERFVPVLGTIRLYAVNRQVISTPVGKKLRIPGTVYLTRSRQSEGDK